MRAADTNLVVRILTRDDEKQAALADAFVAKGAWVSLVVLAEVIWVLGSMYKRDHADLATAVDMLLNHQDLAMQDPEVIAAALEHYRRKPSLGLSDCLILEVAKKAGHSPLGTFDRNLAKLDGVERL